MLLQISLGLVEVAFRSLLSGDFIKTPSLDHCPLVYQEIFCILISHILLPVTIHFALGLTVEHWTKI